MSNEMKKPEGHIIVPSVNVYETETAYVIEALMTGVTKENVDVKLDKDKLTIFGKTQPVKCEQCILREIEIGNYYRVFQTNAELDVQRIHAELESGILKVTLPKHERALPRDIPIAME